MADFIPKQYTKEPITIRIAPDKLAQIDAFAAKFNMSRSEFINQCIDYALSQIETQNYGDAKEILISAQQKAEEIYITAQN